MPFRYILFNKPYAILSTFTDLAGRSTLKEFVSIPGIYAAGRLDYKSEGLLLLTNDGSLIQYLTDPRFSHPKTYLVQVEGIITAEAINRLCQGVICQRQTLKALEALRVYSEPDLPARLIPVRNYHPTSWIQIVLCEGKKHQVRRMTAAVGFPTLRLVRTAIGPLTLKGLGPGEWRELTAGEVKRLKVHP
jgi:23S rRNA pseudouridine2457 synthase